MGRINEEKRKKKIEEQIGKTYGYYTILSFAEYVISRQMKSCQTGGKCKCRHTVIIPVVLAGALAVSHLLYFRREVYD